MNNVINEINQRLENILSQYPDSKVKEAMYYSLKAGGKRIRPLIVLHPIFSASSNNFVFSGILQSSAQKSCHTGFAFYR